MPCPFFIAMFNIETVANAVLPVVGWRQNIDSSGVQLTELTTSESKLYFQGVHPLITIENLDSIAPKHSGFDFTAWLKNKTRDSIIKALTTWQEDKQEEYSARSLVENNVVYDGAGKLSDTEPNEGKFAGFEFNVSKDKGLITLIDRISLHFTQTGDYTVYLYHSSRTTPVNQITLTYTTANQVQWFTLNWELPYHSITVDVGGSYYVSFKQSEAPGEAINNSLDWSVLSQGNYYGVGHWSQFLSVAPFTVDETANLWDIEKNDYDLTKSHGLNFELSVKCDYTQFMVDQRNIFRNIIYYQVGIDLLREMIHNPNSRINRGQGSVNIQRIEYEIDGDTQGRKTGLRSDFERSLKAAKITTEGLSKHCLSCQPKGNTYRSI